jgi:hypothetical protein
MAAHSGAKGTSAWKGYNGSECTRLECRSTCHTYRLEVISVRAQNCGNIEQLGETKTHQYVRDIKALLTPAKMVVAGVCYDRK